MKKPKQFWELDKSIRRVWEIKPVSRAVDSKKKYARDNRAAERQLKYEW